MPVPNTSTSPLAAGAAELQAHGYSILPIMPRQKAPGEYQAGRWKAMDAWTRYKQTAPTKFELSMWSRWPDANIGIILGTPAGDGLVVIAVDLDISDPTELRSAVASLPTTPMVKKGAKGLTLFFRAPPEFKSRAFNRRLPDVTKLDRLADILTGNATKQTVVPPSMHPDGFAYAWVGQGAIPAGELPALVDADMVGFEAAMALLGWEASGSSSAPPGIMRQPISSRALGLSRGVTSDGAETATADVFRDINRAALDDLGSWVPNLGLFNCQPARGGYEAVATWRPSATDRPNADRKRNLSIQSSGIKDFGAEQTYSPIDLVMCAHGSNLAEAYDWLKTTVPPREQVGGVVLAFEPKVGKRGPSFAVPTTNDEVMPPPSRPLETTPAFWSEDSALDEWPDTECFPEGLVGDVVRWICDTGTTPQPLLAYGAALVLVGTAAGRQFAGPTGTGTHLYVLGAAPTGAGKDHPMQCVAAALGDANMASLVGPSDFTSDSAVMRHILERPLSVCLMDEFGSFWKRISNRRAGGWEAAITRALREPWGRSFASMKTKQYAGIGPASAEIWWPAMSILGMSTPGEFFSALSGSDVENGMVNRFLVLATQRRSGDRRTREEVEEAYFSGSAANLVAPRPIVDALEAIRDWQGPLIGPQFAYPADKRPNAMIIKATIEAGARGALFSYRQWIEEQSIADDAFGRFYSRGAETAQRVALIHAIGRSASSGKVPHITHDDVVAAVRLVDWSLRTLWARVSEHQAPTGLQNVSVRILEIMQREGKAGTRITRGRLRKKLGYTPQAEFDSALNYLLDISTIASERSTTGVGRPATHYSLLDSSDG